MPTGQWRLIIMFCSLILRLDDSMTKWLSSGRDLGVAQESIDRFSGVERRFDRNDQALARESHHHCD